VVSITPERLSVWGGRLKPSRILEIPANLLGDPVIEKTQQGMYKLSSIRVPITGGAPDSVVDLCVFDWRFLFPAVASATHRREVAGSIHRMTTLTRAR